MVKKWDVQQAIVGLTFICLHAFGYVHNVLNPLLYSTVCKKKFSDSPHEADDDCGGSDATGSYQVKDSVVFFILKRQLVLISLRDTKRYSQPDGFCFSQIWLKSVHCSEAVL